MTKARLLALLVVVTLVLVPTLALAQGLAMPCRFYGTVTSDGVAVDDGTVITATIDGDEYTATTPSAYGASTYALTISPAEGVTYADGSTITFMIGDESAAETGVWESGGNFEVDLSVGEGSGPGPGPGPGGQGPPGPAGPAGPAGAAGAAGSAGSAGPAGPAGASGAAGEDGAGSTLSIIALVIGGVALLVGGMAMRKKV